MKTNISFSSWSLFVFVLLAFVSMAHAELPRESIFYGTDLENVSVTLGYDREERNIQHKTRNSEKGMLVSDCGYAILGLDVAPWLMVDIGAGQSELNAGEMGMGGMATEEKTMWTLGAVVNIWQGDIFEPDYLTSRWRIQSGASMWRRSSALSGRSVDWNEVRGDLTFSVESFVSGLGENKNETPYSLVLFAGLLYSRLTVDTGDATMAASGVENDYEEDESVGFLGGAHLKVHRKLYVGYEARVYDEVSHTARISYHF